MEAVCIACGEQHLQPQPPHLGCVSSTRHQRQALPGLWLSCGVPTQWHWTLSALHCCSRRLTPAALHCCGSAAGDEQQLQQQRSRGRRHHDCHDASGSSCSSSSSMTHTCCLLNDTTTAAATAAAAVAHTPTTPMSAALQVVLVQRCCPGTPVWVCCARSMSHAWCYHVSWWVGRLLSFWLSLLYVESS